MRDHVERLRVIVITSSIQRLLNLGTTVDCQDEHAQRIRIGNVSCLFGMVGALLIIGYDLQTPRDHGLWWVAVAFPTYACSLFLNASGATILGRAGAVISPTLAVLALVLAAGTKVFLPAPFVIVPLCWMIFGASPRERGAAIACSLSLVALAAALYWPGFLPASTHLPATPSLDPLETFMWGVCLLTVFSLLVASHYMRERTLAELHEARAHAEQGAAAKGRFLAHMSHEIRTPIGAILGYADLLDVPAGNEDAAEALRAVRRNGQHLQELVNNLLDLNKVEADELVLELAPVSIVRVVADVDSAMRPRATAKGLAFEVLCEDEVPRTVNTDALRLRQVLINLVGNAIKFTEEGTIRIEVSFEAAARLLHIAVEDSGVGIEHENLSKLFEPFIQADASVARRYGGTGLGLTIARKITAILGGDLTVESGVGEGSRFCMTLPVSDVEAGDLAPCGTPGPDPRDVPRFRVRRLDGVRVLLAEDFEDAARLLSYQLHHLGCTVRWVEDGRQALDALEEDEFDVVLMDTQMPQVDGHTAIRKLRATGNQVKVISLTAHAMVADRDASIVAGADAYMSKPAVLWKLCEQIHELVGDSAGANAAEADELLVEQQLADDLDRIEVDFRHNLTDWVKSIRNAHSRGELSEVAATAHKIAGTAGAFGHHALGEAARSLERAAADPQASRDALDFALEELCGLADALP